MGGHVPERDQLLPDAAHGLASVSACTGQVQGLSRSDSLSPAQSLPRTCFALIDMALPRALVSGIMNSGCGVCWLFLHQQLLIRL